jgi:transcriptional regulator with XRE-family HTH domain
VSQQKTLENIERGKKLRSLRHQLGMDQKDLAPLLQIHPTYLSQLENGNQTVSDYYLEETERILENSKHSKVETLRESGHESPTELWKRRAVVAENELHQLRSGLRALLELSSSSTPTQETQTQETHKSKSNSSADDRLKAAVEGALNERKK